MSSRKRSTAGLQAQFNAIMNVARKLMPKGSRNNVPAIVGRLLNGDGTYRGQFIKTNAFGDYVLRYGLEQCIRRALKGGNDAEDGSEAETGAGDGGEAAGAAGARQGELWPEDQRDLVSKIGHEMLFVPERDEFVPLHPNEISADELDSAGQYLIDKGEDTITRGQNCQRLAALVRKATKRRRR